MEEALESDAEREAGQGWRQYCGIRERVRKDRNNKVDFMVSFEGVLRGVRDTADEAVALLQEVAGPSPPKRDPKQGGDSRPSRRSPEEGARLAAQWKCISFDKSTGRFRALQKVRNRIHYGASSTSLEVAVQAAIAKFKKTREELWQGADASEASEPLEEPSAEPATKRRRFRGKTSTASAGAAAGAGAGAGENNAGSQAPWQPHAAPSVEPSAGNEKGSRHLPSAGRGASGSEEGRQPPRQPLEAECGEAPAEPARPAEPATPLNTDAPPSGLQPAKPEGCSGPLPCAGACETGCQTPLQPDAAPFWEPSHEARRQGWDARHAESEDDRNGSSDEDQNEAALAAPTPASVGHLPLGCSAFSPRGVAQHADFDADAEDPPAKGVRRGGVAALALAKRPPQAEGERRAYDVAAKGPVLCSRPAWRGTVTRLGQASGSHDRAAPQRLAPATKAAAASGGRFPKQFVGSDSFQTPPRRTCAVRSPVQARGSSKKASPLAAACDAVGVPAKLAPQQGAGMSGVPSAEPSHAAVASSFHKPTTSSRQHGGECGAPPADPFGQLAVSGAKEVAPAGVVAKNSTRDGEESRAALRFRALWAVYKGGREGDADAVPGDLEDYLARRRREASLYGRFPVVGLIVAALKFPAYRQSFEEAMKKMTRGVGKAQAKSGELFARDVHKALCRAVREQQGKRLGKGWNAVAKGTTYHSGALAWLQRVGVLQKVAADALPARTRRKSPQPRSSASARRALAEPGRSAAGPCLKRPARGASARVAVTAGRVAGARVRLGESGREYRLLPWTSSLSHRLQRMLSVAGKMFIIQQRPWEAQLSQTNHQGGGDNVVAL